MHYALYITTRFDRPRVSFYSPRRVRARFLSRESGGREDGGEGHQMEEGGDHEGVHDQSP